MDQITHEVRLAQWAEIIRNCQLRPEGQTTQDWLAENGINIKTYYYWQRRVRKELYDQTTSLATVNNAKTEIIVDGTKLTAPEKDLDFTVCKTESATGKDGNSKMMEPESLV